jgi:hypothetical protein
MELLTQIGRPLNICRDWPDSGSIRGLGDYFLRAVGLGDEKQPGTAVNNIMDKTLGL